MENMLNNTMYIGPITRYIMFDNEYLDKYSNEYVKLLILFCSIVIVYYSVYRSVEYCVKRIRRFQIINDYRSLNKLHNSYNSHNPMPEELYGNYDEVIEELHDKME